MIWRAKLHVLAYTGSLWECEDGVKLSADCTAECEAISDSWPWGGGILYVTCHCTYACAPLYMPYICMSMSIRCGSSALQFQYHLISQASSHCFVAWRGAFTADSQDDIVSASLNYVHICCILHKSCQQASQYTSM